MRIFSQTVILFIWKDAYYNKDVCSTCFRNWPNLQYQGNILPIDPYFSYFGDIAFNETSEIIFQNLNYSILAFSKKFKLSLQHFPVYFLWRVYATYCPIFFKTFISSKQAHWPINIYGYFSRIICENNKIFAFQKS